MTYTVIRWKGGEWKLAINDASKIELEAWLRANVAPAKSEDYRVLEVAQEYQPVITVSTTLQLDMAGPDDRALGSGWEVDSP